ncbi:MAG: cah [Verrucomicrobiaceae bacterium]|nr:cah [Verrucomicrobiaceae bacterium]
MKRYLALLLLAGSTVIVNADPIVRSPEVPSATPWNLDKLSESPQFQWLEKEPAVKALQYEGEPFNGKLTHVFAYYATPATIGGEKDAKGPWPAVVLVHGGGGTAFIEWVELWAKRGYVAIAMDLSGMKPARSVPEDLKKRVRLPDGGPDQGHPAKFETIATEDMTDDWSYHAVANAILAHSLIRSFPEVDKDRTALTGISWGGYTTCIVASLDSRFKAAVPVYGCGFLNENSSWLPEFEKLGPEKTARWVKLYDPGQYLPACRVPLFFVSGTNDGAYPLDSYMKSYDAASNTARQIREQVNMPHGHSPGWAPQEIGAFIDSILLDTPKLPLVSLPKEDSGKVTAVVHDSPVASASLVYTTDDHEINKHEWQTVDAILDVTGGTALAATLPEQAKIYFFTATTAGGLMVSSPVVFRNPVKPQ